MIMPILKIISLTKRYGGNFIANILQQGLRFLILYVAAHQLGPEDFGEISLLLLVANYLLNANLGAVNGLKRQIPLVYSSRGQGFVSKAFFSILNFNWVMTLLLGSITAFVMYYKFDLGLSLSLLLVPLAFSMNSYFNIQAYYTASGNWKQLYRLQMLCAALLFLALASLMCSNKFLLIGLYILSFLLTSTSYFIQNGYTRQSDRSLIRENIVIGFPIMLSGFIYLLFQTTDRLLVSNYYDAADFGYYSFGWVLVMSLNLLVNLSSEMLLQKAATHYAAHANRVGLLRYISNYTALFMGVLAGLSLALLVLVSYAVPIYFPDYSVAIPVINNLIIAYLIQQIGMGVVNYYYIIGSQRIYNWMLVIACVVNAAILYYPFYLGQRPSMEYISELYIWSSGIYLVLLYLPLIKKSLR